MAGIGAQMGLIGKSGERPVRSRHCNEEQLQDMPLGFILGRFGAAMNQSQENCLYNNHRSTVPTLVQCVTCERWGGDYVGILFYRLLLDYYEQLCKMDFSDSHASFYREV